MPRFVGREEEMAYREFDILIWLGYNVTGFVIAI